MNDSKYGLGGSELLFDSVKKDEIVTSFMNECIIKDEYYLLPFMRSTEALYINKDYVNRLGYDIPDIVTWDYVWEVSEKAMEDYEHNKTEDNMEKENIDLNIQNNKEEPKENEQQKLNDQQKEENNENFNKNE